MSYILDALKKSEQERGHGNIPSVQTVHSSSLNYRDEKNTYWPYILIAAITVNILVVLYFILDREPAVIDQNITADQTAIKNSREHEKNIIDNISETDAHTTTQATAASISDKQTTREELIPPHEAPHSSEEKFATSDEHIADNASETMTTVSDNTHIETNIETIDFYDLPESIKQQLPTITISAHVYSSNPLQRSIVINNNFIEEREYVLDDLILHEITSNGAVFDFNSTRFSYPVVSSWQ